jgi:flagellar protein FliO/FliZ
MEGFFEALGLFLVFGAILLLCYYTTRIIGKRLSGGAKNKNMKIVETLPLGLDRCLYLILVGNRHFLFLSSKKGLEMVSEVQIEEQADDNQVTDDKSAHVSEFRRIFETYSGLSSRTEKVNGSEAESEEKPDDPGKGILAGIKRLKRLNARNN